MAHRPYSSYSQERKEKLIKSVSDRRRMKKIQAVEYKGGCCRVCGYRKCMDALQFHHLDPAEKDFAINRMGTWAWARVVKELDKCVLLCNRCHTEAHAEVLDLQEHLTPEEFERAAKANQEEEGFNVLDLPS